jgi:3-hydroxyacyl-CoA dehydrogenase
MEAVDALDVARTLEGFASTGIVIEAVAEKLEVKRAVFREIAAQAGPGAILATNTSSLSVDAIAEGVPYPERVAGMHFFNPVKKMPLVEVIRGKRTSPDAVAAVAGLAVHLGKTPVVVADVAGFLVNRLLGPYLDESLRMFAGGLDPHRIDRALEEFGMPMGPLRLLDEVGFDIATHAAASLFSAYGARMTPSTALESMVREGRLGKKTGKGFYDYKWRGGKRPEIAADLARFRAQDAAPVPQLSGPALTDEEIVDRAVLAMLNEAARAEEDVVAGSREPDLATVFGMASRRSTGLRLGRPVGHAIAEKLARSPRRPTSPGAARASSAHARSEPAAMAAKVRRFHG